MRLLAIHHGFTYALGIHPMCVMRAQAGDLNALAEALETHRADPRLVAVGEIGLDFFVAGLDPEVQQHFYVEQLKLARRAGLPVLLHVRRSADKLLAGLRRVGFTHGGIAHAFNGSEQQAQAFIDLGFKLGFGGTLTFERSLQIRRIAATVPETALVMETDAPDIPAALALQDGRGSRDRPRPDAQRIKRIAAHCPKPGRATRLDAGAGGRDHERQCARRAAAAALIRSRRRPATARRGRPHSGARRRCRRRRRQTALAHPVPARR